MLLATLWLLALPATAQGIVPTPPPETPSAGGIRVDLVLVLAVDVSLSMDIEEQRLQRDGYVAAFRDSDVVRAIMSGPSRRIAITYIEWAGYPTQQIVLPWTLVDGKAAADAVADRLAAHPISRHRMTSISGVMQFAARQIGSGPYRGTRRVVDISGDGPNNGGPPVTELRDKLVADGIVINGLPVMIRLGGMFDIANLDAYYKDCVIGGDGAFVIPIKEPEEFATATRRKLILEISGLAPPPSPREWTIPVQMAQMAPVGPDGRIDCLIGEKIWQMYRENRFR